MEPSPMHSMEGKQIWFIQKALYFNIFFKAYLFILRESQREKESQGEAERENPKQALHYQPRAGLKPTNHEIMT